VASAPSSLDTTIPGTPARCHYSRCVPQPAPVTDDYARHVLARMVDFFTDEGTPWPRRLWDIGSILALEELWEASSWQAAGVLSQSACDWQRNQLRAVIGPDVGLGERELRREVTEILSNPLTESSAASRRLRQVIDHAKGDYLARWAIAVAKTERPEAERFSRTIASHLLDLDFSASYLKSWASSLVWRDADAERIAASAVDLADRGPQAYEVLIALDGVPHRGLAELVETWRSKRQVVEWLAAHEFDTAGIRTGGGFVYSFQAQDPYMAAEQARQMLERMIARSSFLRSGRGGVTPLPHLWVAGHKDPISMHPPARGADVLTLVHEEHLYKVHGARSRIDDALELARTRQPGPAGPRCGWSMGGRRIAVVPPRRQPRRRTLREGHRRRPVRRAGRVFVASRRTQHAGAPSFPGHARCAEPGYRRTTD